MLLTSVAGLMEKWRWRQGLLWTVETIMHTARLKLWTGVRNKTLTCRRGGTSEKKKTTKRLHQWDAIYDDDKYMCI